MLFRPQFDTHIFAVPSILTLCRLFDRHTIITIRRTTSSSSPDYGGGVEIHALLNWVESSGYVLMHASETALSQESHSHTFVFRKQTIMDRL